MRPMLATFEKAALLAGKAILDIYRAGPTTSYKADHSPVTEADEQAELIILAELAKACPGIPVIAEESVAAGRVPSIEGGTFILVDPLDGTKEFINRSADFTVNIALIEQGAPVLGVVHAPALNVAYLGGDGQVEKLLVGNDQSVTERRHVSAKLVATPPVCVASRSHNSAETEAYLKQSGACDIRAVGSSLKFCLLAEGTADLYPRFGRTMEWDTAAGDAVLRAAGGMTLDLAGKPLRYGKIGRKDMADFANPDFIASGVRPHSA
ncbi:3'(2'),5'-bisphosphate nucleotidase CysQ [Rhizobium terrae]|uniref:3'(2'),5'-bisphosphate nucleotidase CysQ n=1 Tax=Rhizobium terrae TaxID=2171756 RepID=UPI000E3BCA4F|nr:3'(2'),5'-bisphosphate nucleotidase CysQ [Rhizobium terrae]